MWATVEGIVVTLEISSTKVMIDTLIASIRTRSSV
jgi:hypothetical protein